MASSSSARASTVAPVTFRFSAPLDFATVQDPGALGLVDIKVCAIDETWSGLKLVWRKERR